MAAPKLRRKTVGRRWKDHVFFRHQNVSVSRFSWEIQWDFKDSKHGEFFWLRTSGCEVWQDWHGLDKCVLWRCLWLHPVTTVPTEDGFDSLAFPPGFAEGSEMSEPSKQDTSSHDPMGRCASCRLLEISYVRLSKTEGMSSKSKVTSHFRRSFTLKPSPWLIAQLPDYLGTKGDRTSHKCRPNASNHSMFWFT